MLADQIYEYSTQIACIVFLGISGGSRNKAMVGTWILFSNGYFCNNSHGSKKSKKCAFQRYINYYIIFFHLVNTAA